MSDEWLKRFSAWRPGLELAALLLGVLVVLLGVTPTAPPPASYVPGVNLIDRPLSLAEAETIDWPDERQSVYTVPAPATIGWLRWSDVALAELDGPLAVRTAGPFSARIYWNGTLIGEKGQPAETADAEIPGQIDAVFSIPPDLIRSSGNTLLMQFSSHRAGYEPMTLVHSLSIIPYRADDRRPLRAYFPLILTGGALLALAFAIAWAGHGRRDGRAFHLSLALTALFLAGAAEASRAFVNYSYDWHQPRQAIMLVFLLIFAATQMRFIVLRWPAAQRRALFAQIATGALAIMMILWSPGYDAKSTLAISIGCLAMGGWIIWHAPGHTRWMALFFCVLLTYALRWPGDFLDRAVYVLVLVFWGFLALRLPDLLVPRPQAAARQVKLLTTGRMILVDRTDILFLKAAGNYTEVHLANGGQHLDNRNLSALFELLQEAFHRQHRSYAINLSQVHEIRSAVGSKYTAVLQNGVELPVSRKEVQPLKARLAAPTPEAGTTLRP
ncbi:MAG: LytTR family DNA-binding domain-containing protein [Maricaulis sp.]|uniref:LytTR family DNA-binding domain-containing protein n=1 Tax=Maricaulis sp. TaxID=1486257 RepID=UPI001B167E2E|nr:LytTR family DNA-binding domain-containing protein [Maricaulis sp.]MBO6728601.1 LytTR family transcriptional regulator [Maricaulis sp.]MBO6847216.1 LytTR family transcriptional regulator [Maricaulis sp.]MBO6876874.1 LytTR family transcriptional regulator [Maricaulis sp.]MDM7985229.1 LytTR family DNA-binding domain-containing protein [Maricaulis sp.]